MSIGQSVITTGRINIRIHRDIEGKMWFGGGVKCLKNLGKLKSMVYKF